MKHEKLLAAIASLVYTFAGENNVSDIDQLMEVIGEATKILIKQNGE